LFDGVLVFEQNLFFVIFLFDLFVSLFHVSSGMKQKISGQKALVFPNNKELSMLILHNFVWLFCFGSQFEIDF